MRAVGLEMAHQLSDQNVVERLIESQPRDFFDMGRLQAVGDAGELDTPSAQRIERGEHIGKKADLGAADARVQLRHRLGGQASFGGAPIAASASRNCDVRSSSQARRVSVV